MRNRDLTPILLSTSVERGRIEDAYA